MNVVVIVDCGVGGGAVAVAADSMVKWLQLARTACLTCFDVVAIVDLVEPSDPMMAVVVVVAAAVVAD